MKNYLLLAVAALVFSACTATPVVSNPGFISGVFSGDVVIDTQASGAAGTSIFALSVITVGANGNVTGMATTKNPTVPVGEVGAVTGSIVSSGVAGANFDLTFTFPTLGKFTGKGTGVHAVITKQIAGTLVSKNAANVIVGNVILALTQE